MRLLLFLTAILAAPPALADPEQCRDAAEAYKTAHEDLTDAIETYNRCVADSAGREDCSAESSDVQSAQDDFESTVRDYEVECR